MVFTIRFFVSLVGGTTLHCAVVLLFEGGCLASLALVADELVLSAEGGSLGLLLSLGGMNLHDFGLLVLLADEVYIVDLALSLSVLSEDELFPLSVVLCQLIEEVLVLLVVLNDGSNLLDLGWGSHNHLLLLRLHLQHLLLAVFAPEFMVGASMVHVGGGVGGVLINRHLFVLLQTRGYVVLHLLALILELALIDALHHLPIS
jgi:hypothetical protein